jgi:hypothetical protein
MTTTSNTPKTGSTVVTINGKAAIAVLPSTSVKLTPQMVTQAKRAYEVKKMISMLTTELKGHDLVFDALFTDTGAVEATDASGHVLVVKKPTTRTALDQKVLAAEYPDVLADCKRTNTTFKPSYLG